MDKYIKAESLSKIVMSEEFKGKSLSFILESDLADALTDILLDFIPLDIYSTEADVIKTLEENSFIMVSINRYKDSAEEMFVEELLHEYGCQYELESDVIFVDDSLLDVVEMNKLHGEVAILSFSEEELTEEEQNEIDTEEFLEDITNEFIENLTKLDEDECLHCFVKNYFSEVYNIGYNDVQIDML